MSARKDASHNVFFALFPDAATSSAIVAAAQRLRREHALQGRWIKPHRLHLTLQFLGEFASTQTIIEQARAAADRVRACAFDVTLDRIGSFRNRSIPWWIGCSDTPAGLLDVLHQLAHALRDVGYRSATAKNFVPHITIARDADTTIDTQLIEPIRWRVDEFRLIDSVLGAQAEYITRGEWRFSDRA